VTMESLRHIPIIAPFCVAVPTGYAQWNSGSGLAPHQQHDFGLQPLRMLALATIGRAMVRRSSAESCGGKQLKGDNANAN
jgi:hypothetical protein